MCVVKAGTVRELLEAVRVFRKTVRVFRKTVRVFIEKFIECF
jgi:hypothetical protein